jgi:Fic family protein
LYIKEFDIKRYFVLDEFYDADRDAYEQALRTADATRNLTEWLDYFVEGVLISILNVKEIVLELSSKMQRVEDSGQVALPEKQREIVIYLREHEKIANKDIQKKCLI